MKNLVTLIIILLLPAPLLAQAQASQQTTLGQMELAMTERNLAYYGTATPPTNLYAKYAELYNNSNGGPRLDSLDIHFKPMMDVSSPVSWFLGALLVIFMRLAIMSAMDKGENVPKLMVHMGLKFFMGVLVMNYPDQTYAIGMIMRDCGVYIFKNAAQIMPGVAQQTPAGSITNIDLEQIRVGSLRRALKDNQRPIIGNGSGITYDLYNQIVNPFVLAGAANNLLPIDNGTLLQKTRLLNERVGPLLEYLSRQPKTTTSFPFVLKRIGLAKSVETGSYGNIASVNLTTPAGVSALYNNTTVYDATRLNAIGPTIVALILPAENLRKEFQRKADAGQFTTPAEYNTALDTLKTSYDEGIYLGASSFIRMIFWSDIGFACGELGGAPDHWGYLQQAYPDEESRNAVKTNAASLSNWYTLSTGRAGGSYAPAEPSDQGNYNFVSWVMGKLSKFRDYVILKGAFFAFDAVIEVYVFILFLAFPFWFYEKTAKAFTGALNSFIASSAVFGVLSLLYLIFDQFMTKILVMLVGSIPVFYSWMLS